MGSDADEHASRERSRLSQQLAQVSVEERSTRQASERQLNSRIEEVKRTSQNTLTAADSDQKGALHKWKVVEDQALAALKVAEADMAHALEQSRSQQEMSRIEAEKRSAAALAAQSEAKALMELLKQTQARHHGCPIAPYPSRTLTRVVLERVAFIASHDPCFPFFTCTACGAALSVARATCRSVCSQKRQLTSLGPSKRKKIWRSRSKWQTGAHRRPSWQRQRRLRTCKVQRQGLKHRRRSSLCAEARKSFVYGKKNPLRSELVRTSRGIAMHAHARQNSRFVQS